MVSLRERGWQEPSASSLSKTHAGMPDYTWLVSFLGAKEGQILDTGLIYNELPLALLTKVLKLAKFLRMAPSCSPRCSSSPSSCAWSSRRRARGSFTA